MDKYGIPIMPCTPISTAGPANPGRQVDRSTGGQVRLTQNALHSYIYLSILVHLSTCLQGLTGAEVNIREQRIMGNHYLFTCRPVNQSTRVDRSRGKYMSSRHYRYSVLLHLSTCQPVNLSFRVDSSST